MNYHMSINKEKKYLLCYNIVDSGVRTTCSLVKLKKNM